MTDPERTRALVKAIGDYPESGNFQLLQTLTVELSQRFNLSVCIRFNHRSGLITDHSMASEANEN